MPHRRSSLAPALALAFVVCVCFAATALAADAGLADTPTPGGLARLLAGPPDELPEAAIAQALVAADPQVRAAAARVVLASGTTSLLPAVAAALGKEEDRGAAREEALALLVLDAARWLGAVQEASRRIDPTGAGGSRAALDEVRGTGALGERLSGYARDPATRPPGAGAVRAPADFPTGFVPGLLRVAPCGDLAMAAAEVDYGPDGRPVAVRVKGEIDSPCREAVVALARASVRSPDAGPATATLLFPLAADAVACIDGWDETEYAGRVGGAVEPPKVLRQAQPRYPDAAKARGEEGIVIVETVLTASGCPVGARVLRGATPSLDRAAVESILGWRFAPAVRDGRAVAVYFTLTVNFSLSRR